MSLVVDSVRKVRANPCTFGLVHTELMGHYSDYISDTENKESKEILYFTLVKNIRTKLKLARPLDEVYQFYQIGHTYANGLYVMLEGFANPATRELTFDERYLEVIYNEFAPKEACLGLEITIYSIISIALWEIIANTTNY